MAGKLENALENLTPEQEAMFYAVDKTGAEAEKTAYSNYSYWVSTLRTFSKNKLAVFCVILLTSLMLFTIIQPYLPNQKDPVTITVDPETGIQLRNEPPNSEFIMGTNSIGQDLWARIWSGTRTSMLIGIAVGGFTALMGIIVGSLWGYVPKLETPIRWMYNVIHNIPQSITLVLIAFVLRPSVVTLIFAMCMTRWLNMAKFIRNQIVIIRDREYNLASRCLGTNTMRVITKNLLPYLTSVIMLRTALAIPQAIGSEVFLTYIGLGLPLDVPSLGNLINEGKINMMNSMLRYQLIFPSIVLSLITISFYIIGTAFSDAADPRNHI